jgi:membrane protein YdbS with pleckstrin-like domain
MNRCGNGVFNETVQTENISRRPLLRQAALTMVTILTAAKRDLLNVQVLNKGEEFLG